MQAGRKPISDEVKKARGTRQPCRSYEEVKVPATAPKMPNYLTKEAKAIWKEELPRVMATGIVDTDASLFARYCALEALVRGMLSNEVVPQGNLLTELRRMGECLGLTGPSSRMTKAAKKEETNPFTALLGPSN